jgi:hypothetical protein
MSFFRLDNTTRKVGAGGTAKAKPAAAASRPAARSFKASASADEQDFERF